MAYKEGTKKLVSLGLEPQQYRKLKKLSKNTRVPMQQYLRESVDDLLIKYQQEVGK